MSISNKTSDAQRATFRSTVKNVYEGTKKALGNDAVKRGTNNSNDKARFARAELHTDREMLQLRKRLGVSASDFTAMKADASAWAAHNAKHATRLYDRATGSENTKSLLTSNGIERRAARIGAELARDGSTPNVNAAMRKQLTQSVHELIDQQQWSAEHRQVAKNLADGLVRSLSYHSDGIDHAEVRFANRPLGEEAKQQAKRRNVMQRLGDRTGAKVTVMADLAGNTATRAGNKIHRATNTATRATYNAATSSVAGATVAAGVAVVGAVAPLAAGAKLAWNAGSGVAAGAKETARAIKKGVVDGAEVTRSRVSERTNSDTKAVRNFFGPRKQK